MQAATPQDKPQTDKTPANQPKAEKVADKPVVAEKPVDKVHAEKLNDIANPDKTQDKAHDKVVDKAHPEKASVDKANDKSPVKGKSDIPKAKSEKPGNAVLLKQFD